MSQSAAMDSRVFLPRGDMTAWVVCLSAGLFFLYEFFQLNIFDVINQHLREDFNLNASQLSWMSSAYIWADILFLLPAGIILDRCSTRKVILSAMMISVIGTLGFALSDTFLLATSFHFLSGIGNAFCFLCCIVLVARWFQPRKQALVVGLLVTMAFIGGMMAHTPFAYLYEVFGWREALLIDAAVGALVFVWIFFTVRDRPEGANPPKPIHHHTLLPGFVQALTNRQNWLAGLYTALLNLPILVLCALWGTSYLKVVHHLPDITASNVVSMIFIGSIFGCPIVGWLSDKQGLRKPLMIMGAVATLIILIPLLMHTVLSPTSLNILFFALGFFTSSQVISYPLIAESNPLNNTGSATGIASIIIMGGGGVGQILFGWLMTQHAQSTVANYTVADFEFAMWMFPIAAVIALVAVLMTRETHCKR